MAHSKSALKRLRQSLERRARNRSVKSRTRTVLMKALFAIEDDATAAEAAVRDAISALDQAAQKGVIHTNAASRSKSRLLKRLNLAQANAVAAAAAAAASAPVDTPAPRRRASRAAAEPVEEKPAARRGTRTRAAAPKAAAPKAAAPKAAAPPARGRGRKTT